MTKMLVSIAAAALLVSGCATVKGAGKDVQSVGQAGQDIIHGKDPTK